MAERQNQRTEEHLRMRRKDRAVTDDVWIRQFLAKAPYITIATSLDGQPCQHVVTFVYDEATHALIAHTANNGLFRRNIDRNPKVCANVSVMGRLLPSEYAREFSVEYESVTVFGTASVIGDLEVGRQKMQLLLDKYFPHLKSGDDYRPMTEKEVAEVAVIKVAIDDWTAKRKQVDKEFPGAFEMGE
ncbi:hypothetical protein GF377_02610 [candidate division GN15 bacterium]|nr:hypothetical protein [candidate division GN15 bacterium]